jgi:transposase
MIELVMGGLSMASRRKYDPDFKMQVIKEALETGNCAAVARRHDLHSSVVSRWVRNYKTQGVFDVGSSGKKGSKTPVIYDPKQYAQLELENEKLKKLLGEKDLEIEILRDLLKKGTHQ